MKIALLNLLRVNNAYGGTEKVFFDMANNLSRLGHDVIAIAHDTHPGQPSFPIEAKVKYINCKVDLITNLRSQFLRRLVPLLTPKKERIKAKIYQKYVPRATKIKHVIDQEKPEIIITFQAVATFLLTEIIKTNIPVISMFHMDPGRLDSPESMIFHQALKKSQVIQVLMPEYIDKIKVALPSYTRVISIPNIVPHYENHSDCTNHVIINVARLCRGQKRQHLIIEAFNLLKLDFPTWTVELWGETGEHPRYTNELKQLIKKYHLENQIKICGTTNDVCSKHLHASIFCFPSSIEGMPLAMTEAMSMGLPIVGCKCCPSVNTIIHHGKNGFLCDDTSEDIAAHLRILMSDTELRQKMGQQAREDMKQYAPEVIWKRWDELLKKVHAGEPIVE